MGLPLVWLSYCGLWTLDSGLWSIVWLTLGKRERGIDSYVTCLRMQNPRAWRGERPDDLRFAVTTRHGSSTTLWGSDIK
jgi:hypothetical protein